jgi:demethylmenaquinone methyltransferase/2-methoxy-6-polyprenyl-1,4-benzoquinol methylase
MMNQLNQQEQKLETFYSTIYKRYDLVNRLFTMGMDMRWRKKAAVECLKTKPSRIIDLCCGTGDMVLTIYKFSLPNARIAAYDFSETMLGVARRKAIKQGADSIEFIQGDVARMPFADGEFNSITIAFGFRNLTYENPSRDIHIYEIARILKAGGRLIILESAVPSNRIVYFFYFMYLRIVLIPLGGLLSGNWKAYRYLVKSSVNYYRRNEISDLLQKNKLVVTSVKSLFLGAASLLTALKV